MVPGQVDVSLSLSRLHPRVACAAWLLRLLGARLATYLPLSKAPNGAEAREPRDWTPLTAPQGSDGMRWRRQETPDSPHPAQRPPERWPRGRSRPGVAESGAIRMSQGHRLPLGKLVCSHFLAETLPTPSQPAKTSWWWAPSLQAL